MSHVKASCVASGCTGSRFAQQRCWLHLEPYRRELGDLCHHEGCDKVRYTGTFCANHVSLAWRAKNGRPSQGIYSCSCSVCGKEWMATKRTSRFCSTRCRAAAARDHRLPVLHPSPDPLTWLPAKHPARRSPKRRSDPWSVIVGGQCGWCNATFLALCASIRPNQIARYCSTRCGDQAGRYRHGRFLIAPSKRRAIYERDGWVCQLCLESVDRHLPTSDIWAATLDHIVCQSWGQDRDDSPGNLRLAHRWCNSVRGDESRYSVEDLRLGA